MAMVFGQWTSGMPGRRAAVHYTPTLAGDARAACGLKLNLTKHDADKRVAMVTCKRCLKALNACTSEDNMMSRAEQAAHSAYENELDTQHENGQEQDQTAAAAAALFNADGYAEMFGVDVDELRELLRYLHDVFNA
jgi:hypothetical protein